MESKLESVGRGAHQELDRIATISAHRGNSGTAALNSIESYRQAIDLGVDFVEFDVRTTADGIYVISHSDQLPAGRSIGAVAWKDYKLELGDDALSLDDLLQVAKGRVGLHCDLKEIGNERDILQRVLGSVGPDQLVVTSLEDVSVKAVKEHFPQLQVGLSLGRDLEGATWWAKFRVRMSELFPGRRVLRCGADFVAVNHRLAALTVLRYCRRHQLSAWVWTVDDEVEILNLLGDPRVTTIITNRPDIAVGLRAAERTKRGQADDGVVRPAGDMR
jgi:glycerophosphoryl diester phosphodiesterase